MAVAGLARNSRRMASQDVDLRDQTGRAPRLRRAGARKRQRRRGTGEQNFFMEEIVANSGRSLTGPRELERVEYGWFRPAVLFQASRGDLVLVPAQIMAELVQIGEAHLVPEDRRIALGILPQTIDKEQDLWRKGLGLGEFLAVRVPVNSPRISGANPRPAGWRRARPRSARHGRGPRTISAAGGSGWPPRPPRRSRPGVHSSSAERCARVAAPARCRGVRSARRATRPRRTVRPRSR